MIPAIDWEKYEVARRSYDKGLESSQFIIGFDISDNGDHNCMTVLQRGHIPGQLIHVNTFWDEEAVELYKKLGGCQVVCGKDRLELLVEGGKGGNSCDGPYIKGKDY